MYKRHKQDLSWVKRPEARSTPLYEERLNKLLCSVAESLGGYLYSAIRYNEETYQFVVGVYEYPTGRCISVHMQYNYDKEDRNPVDFFAEELARIIRVREGEVNV